MNFYQSIPSPVPTLNFIINGNFDFWQRGTSFATINDGAFSADRFGYGKIGTGVHTASRSTDVPTSSDSVFPSTYSLLIDCTTAQASITAGDHFEVAYMMEGYDWAQIKNRTVTVSFWVKATKTGTYCFSIVNNGADRSYVAEYTVNTTETWEKKSITIPVNYSGGTENFGAQKGAVLRWMLACGSTFQTTAGAWANGNFYASSNQVNALDSTSNNFRLAQVKLEIGSVATPFIRRGTSFPQEQLLCQRYYEKSYNLDVDPGTVTTTGAIQQRCSSTNEYVSVWYKAPKMVAPTVIPYNPTSGASGTWRDSGATNKVISVSINGLSYCNFSVASSVDTNGIVGHYTADCDTIA